ncbi:MAG: hypothetical protein IPJ65_13050 [Archangiaceae bacterium]|nr:hypothetical protein [Archangiaceae bacterium]
MLIAVVLATTLTPGAELARRLADLETRRASIDERRSSFQRLHAAAGVGYAASAVLTLWALAESGRDPQARSDGLPRPDRVALWGGAATTLLLGVAFHLVFAEVVAELDEATEELDREKAELFGVSTPAARERWQDAPPHLGPLSPPPPPPR